jgi:hypothetical protein
MEESISWIDPGNNKLRQKVRDELGRAERAEYHELTWYVGHAYYKRTPI